MAEGDMVTLLGGSGHSSDRFEHLNNYSALHRPMVAADDQHMRRLALLAAIVVAATTLAPSGPPTPNPRPTAAITP